MCSTLDTFARDVQTAWGPLTSTLVGSTRQALAALTLSPADEPWLSELLAEGPVSHELLRSPAHGFVLLAHTERQGLYRPPHDHGRAWVVYAVQHGEVEMRTFSKVEQADGGVRLVQRDATVLRAGDAQAYLPGDIHDTRCLSPTALLFRFTERDLRHEDRVEGRVTRYPAAADGWISRR